MNSSPVLSARIPITLAALCGMFIVASPAGAQGGGWAVRVQRDGKPLTPNQVVLYAASEPKVGALAGNVASFAADVINASLDGKAVAAYVDECDDGRVDVHLVLDDPAVQGPQAPGNCRRRRLAAAVILHRGSTASVDIGRAPMLDASNATPADAASGARRLGIGVFGNVGGASSGADLGSSTVAVIEGRFTNASLPYQQYNVDVDDSTSGLAFGGGLNLAFGGNVGARVGVLRESERNVPTQSVDGQRIEGGLRFRQLGTSIVNGWTLYAGPTLTLPWGVVVSGGPSFTFWDVELTQTAQLQALCPTPCATVRTDNLTERSSGSDLGFQLGADYFPGGGWFGVNFMYLRAVLRDAYDPSRPLGYPADWTNSSVYVGAVVRTPQRR